MDIGRLIYANYDDKASYCSFDLPFWYPFNAPLAGVISIRSRAFAVNKCFDLSS